MFGQEVFLLVMRWAHALAALLWIGGVLFYALVIRPAQRNANPSDGADLGQLIASEFRSWVFLSIGILVVTGAVLTVNRLTSPLTNLPYLLVLGTKISLALIMFLLVRSQRRSQTLSAQLSKENVADRKTFGLPIPARIKSLVSRSNMILALGLTVFLLADILRDLVEKSLRGG